jgi:ankyrin repeat protein
VFIFVGCEKKVEVAEPIDLGYDLIQAAKGSDVAEVERLLEAGADVDRQGIYYGRTALMWAARNAYGLTEIVELLINAGTDLNVQNDNGDTALIRATDKNYTEIIQMLKAAGATE